MDHERTTFGAWKKLQDCYSDPVDESEFHEILKRLTKKMADAKKFQKRVAKRIKEMDAEIEALRSARKTKDKG